MKLLLIMIGSILIALKASGMIIWSWWWVLLPLVVLFGIPIVWCTIAAVTSILVVSSAIAGIFISKRKGE